MNYESDPALHSGGRLRGYAWSYPTLDRDETQLAAYVARSLRVWGVLVYRE